MPLPEQADKRRELVARLLAQKATPQGVTPLPRDGSPLACSHEQRRIWLAQQSDPTAAPNVTLGVRLTGALDLARLADACTALIARHEALHTVYTPADGEPYQEIRPGLPAPFEFIDLSGLPEPEREATALGLARTASAERFAVTSGPILRLTVYRISAWEHRLFLVCHHIAADGGSLAIMADDLASLYSGARPSAPPVQYADYAAWSAERSARRLPERLPYWTERLSGLPAPLFGGRPAESGVRSGATAMVRVDREAVDRLRRAADGPATPFVCLCAAYVVLLQRMTGHRDVTVGIVSASRTRRELESVVGTFVNMVPLRVAQPAGQTFAGLLTRVREAAAGALANEIPFDTLVSRAGIPRIPGVHPVFQASFVHREDPKPPADWDGLTAQVWDHEVDDATLDLALTATPRGEQYELAFTGRLARFSPAEVHALPATFAALLAELGGAG
ncbi:hypothetical protein Aph01nite_80950 [Acrocarpospora phusangensis]|uniref:Condensation domain-containing protein n=1 Tax=Acrocarpospora phusangensis TaxID=1070424 RepID=A0A919QP27_9ACTN|nr:condensation domain-containing protein [Acrocarpospora phusangensis]GIH29785.1 hypothetical protein Aph01nite_80950 [Acrocarpospora phusangensis]